MRKWILYFWLPILAILFYSTVAAEKLQIYVEGHAARVTYQVAAEDKLLVSVLDSNGDPIRGLKREHFTAGLGIQKAEILSAEALEDNPEVPLNIVFVVDNSFSMKERRAVGSLLSAMDEFFKTMRPIDNIHLVVFNSKAQAFAQGRMLHVKTFQSNDINRLKDFLQAAFEQELTGGTYLYEGILAAIDIIRSMPVKARFPPSIISSKNRIRQPPSMKRPCRRCWTNT